MLEEVFDLFDEGFRAAGPAGVGWAVNEPRRRRRARRRGERDIRDERDIRVIGGDLVVIWGDLGTVGHEALPAS